MTQFNYCQLVCMCHNRTKNNKINRLHERCYRLIYNDKNSSFEQLLEIDSSVFVHDKHCVKQLYFCMIGSSVNSNKVVWRFNRETIVKQSVKLVPSVKLLF